MRRIVILLYMVVAAVLLTGCGADSAIKKGDKFYALGEYYDAANQYKKAYAKTPTKERRLRGERAAKMADCYRRINNTQRAVAASSARNCSRAVSLPASGRRNCATSSIVSTMPSSLSRN